MKENRSTGFMECLDVLDQQCYQLQFLRDTMTKTEIRIDGMQSNKDGVFFILDNILKTLETTSEKLKEIAKQGKNNGKGTEQAEA